MATFDKTVNHFSIIRLQSHKSVDQYLINIGTGLGGSLNIGHGPGLRALVGVVQLHLSLLLQVRLVSHQQKRNVVIVLHSQNLLPANTQCYNMEYLLPANTQCYNMEYLLSAKTQCYNMDNLLSAKTQCYNMKNLLPANTKSYNMENLLPVKTLCYNMEYLLPVNT